MSWAEEYLLDRLTHRRHTNTCTQWHKHTHVHLSSHPHYPTQHKHTAQQAAMHAQTQNTIKRHIHACMHPQITCYFTTHNFLSVLYQFPFFPSHSYLIAWPAVKSIGGVSPSTGAGMHKKHRWLHFIHERDTHICGATARMSSCANWTCAIYFRSRDRGLEVCAS